MINVKIDKNKITANGHAGYAQKGYDIVCAAFSMLSITLELSIEKLTNNVVDISMSAGHLSIEWERISPGGLLLINSYIEGLKALAETYPEYIKVQARNTLKAEE